MLRIRAGLGLASRAVNDRLSPAATAATTAALDAAGAEADACRSLRQRLARRVHRLAPAPGLHPLDGLPLVAYRADDQGAPVCMVYEPCVALILQGSKRLVVGEHALLYDTERYLVVPVDMPVMSTILEASPEQPYLTLVLRLNLRLLAQLLLEGALPRPEAPPEGRAMATGAVTAPLLDAFGRLLDLADQPALRPALAPLVEREILCRLLLGEAGGRLRQIATIDSQSHHIARIIGRLKQHHTAPLRVEELARDARMSVSTFHHHFKAITGMSPLQFQKRVRLAEARRLMLAENLEASTAAYRVGYESASQFSREYAREFGAPPSRDIAALRGQQAQAVAAG
jgi:AraC-like DNA-binding protein